MAILDLLAKTLRRKEDGQAMVEYGLILAMIAIAALVGLTFMGGGVDGLYEAIRTVARTMADSLA